jgi:hypothetical protein
MGQVDSNMSDSGPTTLVGPATQPDCWCDSTPSSERVSKSRLQDESWGPKPEHFAGSRIGHRLSGSPAWLSHRNRPRKSHPESPISGSPSVRDACAVSRVPN